MTVTMEVNSTWARIVRSPIYYLVAAFTGVSTTFCPLFLYWSGKGTFFPQWRWFIVPACFAITYLVPFFYLGLAAMLVKELRKHPN